MKTQDARIVVFGGDRPRTTAPVGSTSTRGTVQGRGDTRRQRDEYGDEYQGDPNSMSRRTDSRPRGSRYDIEDDCDEGQTSQTNRRATSTPRRTSHQPDVTQGNETSFRQLVDIMSLPKPALQTFNGDPMMYHIFMNSFNTCIDAADVSDASKLNRLFELCQGKARTLINTCALMQPPSRGYKHAKDLLRERFGDDYVISEAWVSKITAGPPVKANNIDSLQSFTDDVRGCVETLRSMDRLAEVDTRSRLLG